MSKVSIDRTADMDRLEPVAIVGMSFGFPGEANTSQSLWDMMMSKKNASREFPKDRLDVDGLYHPDPNRRGQMPVRGGNFLENIDAFDAPFFSVSETEAGVIDPQQRGLLEHTYKALENAGMSMESVSGSKTSVFTGCFGIDYMHLTFKDTEQAGTTMALGLQPCINANRLSWFYNFTGNSANIDTACSSSLVALDMGVSGLLRGDEDMSVVAGCNLVFSPDMMYSLTYMRMLSPDGKSYSFDHRANGYARGEGFGVLILKRLKDALRDGNTIRAVVRSTGSNQDGHTPGMTTPSSRAQETLIRETYEKAGLSMGPTRYFEAHGTGTPVGDPLEAMAIGSAFRNTRTLDDPLIVGALKSNVGHLEGAAGIAGVVKAVLVLERGVIPPNTNFEKLNPKIDADFLKIKFPQEPMPWPTTGLRRASVNSFGFGGTNSHAILDDAFHFLQDHFMVGNHATIAEPPQQLKALPDGNGENSLGNTNGALASTMDHVNGLLQHGSAQSKLLFLSSHDERGTARQAAQFSSISFEQLRYHNRDHLLDDLAFTLNHKRSSLSWNSFALVESLDDIRELKTRISPAVRRITDPSIGFIFTGQGAQWAQMAEELLQFPTFNRSLAEAEEYLLTLGCRWRLREEMFKPAAESAIHKPELSQPLCTALQIALIDLLDTLGVRPTAVVGHSSGEIAAAYAAGALSAQSAWAVAYYRGTCAADLAATRAGSDKGAMIAIGLSQQAVLPYIARVAEVFGNKGLSVACINSPRNVTVSGDADQIEALRELVDAEKIFARRLAVDVAYHSPHMEAISQKYSRLISDVGRGGIGAHHKAIMVSSVTGDRVTTDELARPEYWMMNMVSPVRFADAMARLFSHRARRVRKRLDLSHREHFHIDAVVEVGPHSALQGPIRDILAELPGTADISYSSILVRNQGGVKSMLTAMGQIKCLGYPVDLFKLNNGERRSSRNPMILPDLPSYPFDHSKRYWSESRLSKHYRLSAQGKLDLLGKPVPDWNPMDARWRNIIRVSELPWLEDHVINGALVYPGAGLLVMAIEAAKQLADTSHVILGFELKDCSFERALSIPRTADGIEVQTSLVTKHSATDTKNSWSAFRICAYENEQWHECCHGSVRVDYESAASDVDAGRERHEELNAAQRRHEELAGTCLHTFNGAALYKKLAESGLGFGPSFQPITSGRFSEDGRQTQGSIRLFKWSHDQYPQEHVVHPTSLDGMLHLGTGAISRGGQQLVPTTIPTLVRNIWIGVRGLSCADDEVHVEGSAWIVSTDNRGFEIDGVVLNAEKSALLARISGMKLTIVSDTSRMATSGTESGEHICYNVEYRTVPDMWMGRQENIDVTDLVNRLAHQKPGLSILQVSSGDNCSTGLFHRVLQTLTTTDDNEITVPTYDSFVLASPSGKATEEIRALLEKFPSTRLVEIEGLAELDAGSFDLIIANSQCISSTREIDTTSVQQLETLLKHVGYLSIIKDAEEVASGLSELSLPKNTFTELLETPELQIHMKNRDGPSDTLHYPYLFLVVSSKSGPQAALAKRIKSVSQAATFALIQVVTLEEAISVSAPDGAIFLVLLELQSPFLYEVGADGYYDMQKFIIARREIVWVNPYGGRRPGRPEYAVLNGWARVIRQEFTDHHWSTIQLEVDGEIRNQQIDWIYRVLTHNHVNYNANVHHEWEYVEREKALSIARLIANREITKHIHTQSLAYQTGTICVSDAPPLALTVGAPGLLDTLHFIEDDSVTGPLGEDEVEVRTRAVGMNFKDCLIALGQLSGQRIGLESAGIVARTGKAVTGFRPGDRVLVGAQMSTIARAKESGTFKIPDSMSFAEAAAIPTQFGTAWEVVVERARLRKDETILIHAAAGGTGQAAVQIAHHVGATVYATVGSADKKQLLMDEYGIPEERIFYSRNTDFAKGVMRVTGGRGVDVVLNSLSGESLVASWGLVASHGRFVEIGKTDIVANSGLPMLPFLRNASFIGFDLTAWAQEKPTEARRAMQNVIDLFGNKVLHGARPLHVYDIAEVESVFRRMQSGRVLGKMVMEVQPESRVKATLATRPSFMLDPSATYVIAGGLGGAGRDVARWMVGRKARNLVLLSRSGPRTDEARELLSELRGQGIRVEAPSCNIADQEAVRGVFDSLSDMPAIRGCIQGTMVRENVMFENLSYESYWPGAAAKAQGSWNLHTVLPRGMDFFVLLSSASGLVGLRGQLSYNAGNTYEDAFARWRVSCGERAVSLDLGGLIDDGVLAETPDLLRRVLGYGIVGTLTRSQFHAILDYYCNPARPLGSPRDSQVVIGISTGQGSGLDRVETRDNPLFSHVHYAAMSANRSTGVGASHRTDVNYRHIIAEATSLGEAAGPITDALVDKLAVSLSSMQDKEAVDIHKPLHAYGVDSLLAVELRNWIGREFQADVAVFETLGSSTFSTLGMLIAERSRISHPTWHD